MSWLRRSFEHSRHVLAPERFPWPSFLRALALGCFGGWLFARLGLPLPWMLGSMTLITLGALLRWPLAAPGAIRPPMTAIIGVLLGVAFHPGLIAQLPGWIATLLGLAAFSAAAGAACVFYLRRVAGYDAQTAYFAGMPGGLVEMIEMASEKGADARIVALTHSARILLIVMSLPFIVQLVEGVDLGARASRGVSVLDAPFSAFALLAGCALAGVWLGGRLALPARHLLGPLLVSAAVHATGLSGFAPPIEIVQGAQVVLGAVLGCRFIGAEPRMILRVLAVAAGMTAILLTVTVAFAAAMGRLTGIGLVTLVLAYSPGGLAEMSLVALAVHADVAFVAAHHVARVLIVMLGAAWLHRRLADRPGTIDPDPAPRRGPAE